jgi:hypothetical protein
MTFVASHASTVIAAASISFEDYDENIAIFKFTPRGGAGIGDLGSVFVVDNSGNLRKSADCIGQGGRVFEIIGRECEEDSFMLLYCDGIDGEGGGLLRVIDLQQFVIADEYECDVAITCMLIHGSFVWCGGADGSIYTLQFLFQHPSPPPQLLPPTILVHHSFLIKSTPSLTSQRNHVLLKIMM